jgi:endonuclease/exonuclease/phosphatase family metal-dependent hydrolase
MMFRILTQNLNYYIDRHGAWDARRDMLVELLNRWQPDLAAFQAVRRDLSQYDGLDQAAQLARQAGYAFTCFQPADSEIGGLEAGSALISRLPIQDVDFLRLTNIGGIEDTSRRVLLSGRVDSGAGSLHVFNAHFSWVAEQLQNNIDEALPFITAVQEPAVLVGDLNAPAGQGLLYLFEEAGWVDAWKALHPAQPGFTFEAGRPSIRIDYAWLNPFLAARLQAVDLVADQTGPHGEHVSDHYGLMVTLDL